MTNPFFFPLWRLITGTRGGSTRAKIIKILKEKPQNSHQLATLLELDYKTVRHHLEVLKKNRVITTFGDNYGTTYFLSKAIEDEYSAVEAILNKAEKEQKPLKQHSPKPSS